MDENEFNIEMSRAAAVTYYDKDEGRRLYYNAEMEWNFPDDEMLVINGHNVPKRIYEKDKDFQERVKQYELEIKPKNRH